MIFTDLESAILARLSGDAWFQGLALSALNSTPNSFGPLDQAASQLGLGGMVSIERVRRGATGDNPNPECIVSVVFRSREIPLKNRRSVGFKTAFDMAVKAMTLLSGWTPVSDGIWSRLDWQSLDLVESDETKGRLTWQLVYETRTMLIKFEQILGTEDGDYFVTETGVPLLA